MSKSIRIKDYLYQQIEQLANENRRPLIGQLEILLEQALKWEAGTSGGIPESETTEAISAPANPAERKFRPDPKPAAKPKKSRYGK